MSKKLGELIKEARTKKGITQAELAAAVEGLTASEVSKAERGESEPLEAEVRAIAKALGVTQTSLVSAMSEKKSSKTTGSSAKSSKSDSQKAKTGKSDSQKAKTGKSGSQKAKTTSASSSGMKLSAAEKELITSYRKADENTKNLVRSLLAGEAPKKEDLVGSLLGNAISLFAGKL